MKRSDYGKAASIVRQHYREVLDDLTEEILDADSADPVLEKHIDPILESYSHKLWYVTTCLDQLRHASEKPENKPAQVEKIDCSRDSVTALLGEWLKNHDDATILSVSILDNVDELTCIIVFRPPC